MVNVTLTCGFLSLLPTPLIPPSILPAGGVQAWGVLVDVHEPWRCSVRGLALLITSIVALSEHSFVRIDPHLGGGGEQMKWHYMSRGVDWLLVLVVLT